MTVENDPDHHEMASISSRSIKALLRSKRERRELLNRASSRQLFLIVFLPVLVVYLATASWTEAHSPDTYMNSLTAYNIANEGTVYLDDYLDHRFTRQGMWLVDAGGDRFTSQYPPAAAAHAVPFYWLSGAQSSSTIILALEDEVIAERDRLGCPVWPRPCPEVTTPAVGVDREVDGPPIWPAALTAALITALAMGLLALTFRAFAPGTLAVGAAYVAAFGTSAWSVGADELWQHSAGMLWISVAGFALSRSSGTGAGLAYAVAIAVRPVSAGIAAGTPAVALLARRWKTAIAVGVGLVAGLAFVVWYNSVVFGTPSISGGYGSYRGTLVFERSPGWFLMNYLQGLFAPRYGLLVWSPFLAVLAVGLPAAWKASPSWARGPALGAAAYLLLQWSLNRASGGALYLWYRYPLEPLMAAAPILLLAYIHGVQGRPRRAKVMKVAVLFAIVAHFIASLPWLSN